MIPMRNGSVVLELVIVLSVADGSLGIASGAERALHLDCRRAAHREDVVRISLPAEPGFIYRLRAENLRVADLNVVLGLILVEGLRRKRKLREPGVLVGVMTQVITHGQGVVLAELEIEPRAEISSRPGIGH